MKYKLYTFKFFYRVFLFSKRSTRTILLFKRQESRALAVTVASSSLVSETRTADLKLPSRDMKLDSDDKIKILHRLQKLQAMLFP